MWVMTPIGFFSIVQKPWDRESKTLTIRARVRSDLEALRNQYLPQLGEIIDSSDSDYRYRAGADQEAVAAAMAQLTQDIEYDNFKDAVAQRQGYGRAAVYAEVWQVIYGLQKPKSNSPTLITAEPVHGAHSRRGPRGQ